MENNLTETKQLEFKIDYLSVTLHEDEDLSDYIWNKSFAPFLGVLIDQGFGGRGYKRRRVAEKGSKIYSIPTSGLKHFNIELPGKACACVPAENFKNLFTWLQAMETDSKEGFRYKVKRIDLAFDNVPFVPEMVLQAIVEDRIRSLTQRDSLQIYDSPFKQKEDGSGYGQSTVYFGAPSSTRKIRVYDKRGPTRFEFVAKDKRSDRIARELLPKDGIFWPQIAMGHIRDFIDIFETPERKEFADWWQVFIAESQRANMIVYSSTEITEERVKSWMEDQCSKWLYVIDKRDPKFIERIKKEAARKLLPHHQRVLYSGKSK